MAVLLASVVAVPSTAAAATTTAYHGILQAIGSGTWNVALHGTTTATVTVNILVNGKHHVSFGYGRFDRLTPGGGETFAVAIPTEAGPLRVGLTGDTFVHRIAPYKLFGLECESVTYNGIRIH